MSGAVAGAGAFATRGSKRGAATGGLEGAANSGGRDGGKGMLSVKEGRGDGWSVTEDGPQSASRLASSGDLAAVAGGRGSSFA